jgi:putative acetyltransferase
MSDTGPGPDDEPILRPAVDADAAGLIVLVSACFSEYEGCVLDTETEMVHLLQAASHYAAAGGRAWVAEAADAVIGSVACRPATGEKGLELQMLYVMAPWRRRGLGSRFVDLVEATARGRGATYVDLWSDTRFTDAHRLYRALGYEQLSGCRTLQDLSATRAYHFIKKSV